MKFFNKLFLMVTMFLIAFTYPVFSFDLIVPDTGQDLCYDWTAIMDCPSEGEEFYGQDGSYTINPPDLTDNGDGTVTDNLRGLDWEQKTAVNEPTTYSYSNALTYCNELTLGSHDDWRVPTRREYSTTLNYGTTSPSLNKEYFPYYTSEASNIANYWTSSEYYNDTSQVWLLRLAFGLIDKTPKTPDPYRVRCVRGSTEPSANYTDNGDSTVTDNVTGFMWEQKTQDGGNRDKNNTYTWKNALAYCENLLLGEYDDWRLPNPKELETTVDLGSSSPAINTTSFPNTSSGLYWTGTSCSGCHKMKAFVVDFSDGELYYGNKFRNDAYDENYVRCVRQADPDNDGIVDPDDNCPTTPNGPAGGTCSPDSNIPAQCTSDSICECQPTGNCSTDQEDSDGDGHGDVCDNCPNNCNDLQWDADVDGIGDVCDPEPGCGHCAEPQCEAECSRDNSGAAGGTATIALLLYKCRRFPKFMFGGSLGCSP